MAVVIDSGPITATRHAANVPQSAWPALVSARRSFCKVKLPYDCRELLRFVEESQAMLEPLGYTDVADFVRRGLELDPEMVDWAITGLQSLKPNEPVTLQRAVEAGLKHHGFGPGRGHKRDSDSLPLLRHGRGRDYIMARLQRDGRAQLLADIYAGEKSARAAAIEAGYLKPKTLTRFEKMQTSWTKLSKPDRRKFLRWADDNL